MINFFFKTVRYHIRFYGPPPVSKTDTPLAEWSCLSHGTCQVRGSPGQGERAWGSGLCFQELWQGGRLKGDKFTGRAKDNSRAIPRPPIHVIVLLPTRK